MSDKCNDCGTPLNAGEAACFTVCDGCWDKAYKPQAARTATLEGLVGELVDHLARVQKGDSGSSAHFYHRCYLYEHQCQCGYLQLIQRARAVLKGGG